MSGSPGERAGGAPAPRTDEAGVLAQELVYAGLEALAAVTPLDLCAYLHVAADEGPQLFLKAPSLSTVDPTEAFTLFTALRDALDSEHPEEHPVPIAGHAALAVRTHGTASRGMHVAGRRAGPLEERERQTIAGLARRFADVAHALESLEAPAPRPVVARVSLETLGGRARAEVEVASGAAARTGSAEATTPPRAVAAAALDAVDPGLKLVDCADDEIAGERAVLALIADGTGAPSIGCALVGEAADVLRAAAEAAIDAASRRRGPR